MNRTSTSNGIALPILPAPIPQEDPIGALGIILKAIADEAPGAIPAQIDRINFPDGQYSSREQGILVAEEVLAASADPLADAFAAVLVPGVLGAVLIEVNSDRGVAAWAGRAVAGGAVAAADICGDGGN